MDVVTQDIQSALNSKGHIVDRLHPGSCLERFSNSRVIMRYLRYIEYPLSLRWNSKNTYQIQHVIDHGYAHLFPSLRSPVRITHVHDLIPLLTWLGVIESDLQLSGHPGISRRVRRPMLNQFSLSFIRKFDHIISISESTAEDLVDYLNISRNQITVIPSILNPKFKPLPREEIDRVRAKYKLSSQIKWVMISGRESYKNHENAFAAVAKVGDQADKAIGLLKTGTPSDRTNQLAMYNGLEGNLRHQFIDEVDLPAVYNAVDCLLFPSLYEGFGMPVIEALACGTPVVASNRGALSEMPNDLVLKANPFDTESLANLVMHALFDCDYQKKVSDQGPKIARLYNPDAVGQRIIDLYRRFL